MATMKFFIAGKLVDQIPFNFLGLDECERYEHIEAYRKAWLKSKGFTSYDDYEIYIDNVPSMNGIIERTRGNWKGIEHGVKLRRASYSFHPEPLAIEFLPLKFQFKPPYWCIFLSAGKIPALNRLKIEIMEGLHVKQK